MKKYVYYHDGLIKHYVVRETITDDYLLAEAWDYKTMKWIPDANAWETIDDNYTNWGIPEDNVKGYIQRMLREYPECANHGLRAVTDGAKRRRGKGA